MRKIVAFILSILTMITPIQVFSVEPDTFQCVEDFFETRYASFASLQSQDLLSTNSAVSSRAKAFLEIEQDVLDAEIAANKAADVKYINFALDIDCREISKTAENAVVVASVVCSFNYEETPDVDSEMGTLHYLELERNTHGQWEIVDKNAATFFEKSFWNNAERSTLASEARKNTIINNLSASSSSCSTYIDNSSNVELDNVARSGYSTFSDYMRAISAQNARLYVTPNSNSWVTGSGYSYSYPSGYSQKTLDCTNFVSFCLNYDGSTYNNNIPQDNTGSYKWTPSQSAWYNVDRMYSYLVAAKSSTEKGISASVSYSGTGLPSHSQISNITVGDIVQFSNLGDGDWTHTAIITSVSATNIYVCMHDAYSYTNNCVLSTFFNSSYNNQSTIRFIHIDGFYE